MIVKNHSRKYLPVILISILLVITMGLSDCATPEPVPTGSESASRIAELEAEVRRLEAGNQRLLRQNEQLSSDLAKTTSEPAPGYHTLSFTLEGEEDYSFPVYLCNDETLHLVWRVEDRETKVWFHILTPSGKGLGFYEDDGNYADGTLCDHATRGMVGSVTQFSPSDYDWGEGYYTMIANKYSDDPVTVRVEYWIGD